MVVTFLVFLKSLHATKDYRSLNRRQSASRLNFPIDSEDGERQWLVQEYTEQIRNTL
jgi:hypothetical protein